MTDDAELRARIEAQVAARRADAASSETDESPESHAEESAPSGASARGGKGLTPTRPWQRRGPRNDLEAAPDGPAAPVDEPAPNPRRGGVGPARPWAGQAIRAQTPGDSAAHPEGEIESEPSGDGRLRPARPWQGRRAAEPVRAEVGSAPPTPSHPQVVLHGIGDEDAGEVPAPPPRMRGLLQRGGGKRRSDDVRDVAERDLPDERSETSRDLAKRRAEAELRLAAEREQAERALADRRAAAERELAEQRAEAERLRTERAAAERALAEQRAEAERLRVQREEAERVLAERQAAMEELPETTAVYVPDDAAVGAFAEAAGALQDQPADDADDAAPAAGRRTLRRRKSKDAPIAARHEVSPLSPPADAAAESAQVADEPGSAEAETAAASEALVEPETPAAVEPPGALAGESVPDAAANETYPWQHQDEVDLDLHGAQTWDPGMYPPEDAAPQQRRGRRALRWLLARAPEPAEDAAASVAAEAAPDAPAPATYEPEPRLDLPVAHLPVEDHVSRDPAPVVDEPTAALQRPAVEEEVTGVEESAPPDLPVTELPAAAVGTPVPAEADVPVADLPAAAAETAAPDDAPAVAATADTAEPAPADAADHPAEKRGFSLFGWLRRRAAAESEEEQEEGFALPPLDDAWLDPPKPTRDWARRTAPIELGATAEEIAAVVPDAAAESDAAPPQPEPAPEPVAAVAPQPEPEPEPTPVAAEVAAEVAAKPAPAPGPAPEPVVRRRPSPGAAAAGRRPSPVAAVAPAAADATTASPAAAPAAAEPNIRPRRRPSPGSTPPGIAAAASTGTTAAASTGTTAAASTGTAAGSGRPMPFELAGSTDSAPAETPRKTPDISRFLAATEADEREDADKDADGSGRGGGDGRWRSTLTRTGVTLLIAALAAVLLRVFIVQPYYIPSASMEPTLHGCPGCNDDHVLVDKISYDVHSVRVGDIVVFHKPDNAQVPEDVLIKRVIALGGDRISMKKGRVFVNGGALDESYLNKDHSCYATDPSENFGPRTVPDGDVFVMGDNRCNSEDSREFGPIKTSSIIGRAFMIVWPLNRIRFLGS